MAIIKGTSTISKAPASLKAKLAVKPPLLPLPPRLQSEAKYGLAPVIPPKVVAPAIRNTGTDNFRGAAGSDYRTMLDFGVSRGYYPGQITLEEMPYLDKRGTPSTIAALAEQPYTDMGPLGFILQGSAIGNQLLGTGGGGGGGGGAPTAAALAPTEPAYDLYNWTQGAYEAPGGDKPSWWRAMTPDRITERSSYAMMLNSMIPYMSPEDQVRAANSLYTFDPEGFSLYKFDRIPEMRSVTSEEARYRAMMGIPLEQASQREVSPGQTRSRGLSEFEFSTPLREKMLGGQRGRDAITALSNMREATVQGNRWKLGPGYTFLQDILGNIGNYGGDEAAGQNRSDYLAMLGALDPVMAMAGNSDLAAYGPMSQMLANPFFTAGQVRPSTQAGNRRLFGTPNPLFY